MTQPTPRDGINGRLYFFPETGTRLIEYSDDGCLVMLGEPDCWGKHSLNVRLDTPEAGEASFARLRAALERACARHGFAAQPEADDRRFFDRTRGYGVLWAWRRP